MRLFELRFFSILQFWYVEVQISRSISESPLDFEITRVDCIWIPVLNANSVDPDQTPRSMAFDLDLHCLPMSLLWDAMQKWVKNWISYWRHIESVKLVRMWNFMNIFSPDSNFNWDKTSLIMWRKVIFLIPDISPQWDMSISKLC